MWRAGARRHEPRGNQFRKMRSERSRSITATAFATGVARGRTGISALYPIAGAHATADTPVGRSRSETQVAHYAAVKPDNRSVGGGGGSGGGGGGGDGNGGSGGGSNGSGSDSSTRTGTDKLDGLPIPLISVPGAENAAGQLWKANFYRRTTAARQRRRRRRPRPLSTRRERSPDEKKNKKKCIAAEKRSERRRGRPIANGFCGFLARPCVWTRGPVCTCTRTVHARPTDGCQNASVLNARVDLSSSVKLPRHTAENRCPFHASHASDRYSAGDIELIIARRGNDYASSRRAQRECREGLGTANLLERTYFNITLLT